MSDLASLTQIQHSYDARHRPFAAYGAAARMWSCRDLEVVLEGPAGTGKSRALLEKGHWCANKYPGCRILLVRKTRESLTESTLVTFEEQVLPEGSPIAEGASRATRKSYDYPNGSTIVVGGMVASGKDQRAKIMSTEYDMILVFEATELSEHEYEQLLTRLRNGVMPYQQLIADCNPDAPTHWLHRRCDRGIATVFFSRHQDNPRWFDRRLNDWTEAGRIYIEKTLGNLSGVRRARLLEGKRAAAEGAVYEFDRNVHLIDEMPRGWESWRKFRVVDFGYTNPFVCQWWAIDGDGRMYLYREIYKTQELVAEHAKTIIMLSQQDRYLDPAIVADHDAEDRATLHKAGLHTIAAKKMVKNGIQAVQQRLAVQPDGKPRLFFLSSALVGYDPLLEEAKKPTSTIQEFDGYVWPKGRFSTLD